MRAPSCQRCVEVQFNVRRLEPLRALPESGYPCGRLLSATWLNWAVGLPWIVLSSIVKSCGGLIHRRCIAAGAGAGQNGQKQVMNSSRPRMSILLDERTEYTSADLRRNLASGPLVAFTRGRYGCLLLAAACCPPGLPGPPAPFLSPWALWGTCGAVPHPRLPRWRSCAHRRCTRSRAAA